MCFLVNQPDGVREGNAQGCLLLQHTPKNAAHEPHECKGHRGINPDLEQGVFHRIIIPCILDLPRRLFGDDAGEKGMGFSLTYQAFPAFTSW